MDDGQRVDEVDFVAADFEDVAGGGVGKMVHGAVWVSGGGGGNVVVAARIVQMPVKHLFLQSRQKEIGNISP